MRVPAATPARVVCIFFMVFMTVAAQSRPDAKSVDPKIVSIHPFAGQPGSTFTATVHGSGLAGAAFANLGDTPFIITVSKVEPESPATDKKPSMDLVTVEVQVKPDAKPGSYSVRLITPHGITNALPLRVVDAPVALEPGGPHDTQESAVPVSAVPAAIAGRLSHRGEADFYSFHADAGQTLTFDVISGLPQTAAAGSAATIPNFDPALSIYESEGSWFDPSRLKRIAYNDEPVFVFGQGTDAHLTQRFAKAGNYLLRVEAFAGQGGVDYSYLLKVAPGQPPQKTSATSKGGWAERSWTRRLEATRLNEIAARGGRPADQKIVETYRAGPAEPITFRLPATIQGVIANPGETHKARFHLDGPADIALEVETPGAYPPFFNPIVRLVSSSGEEVATNLFAGKGACSGALSKSAVEKTVIPLRDPGDYTIEVRDVTADLAGPDFQYRLQVRPQIPHVGDVKIDADHINLMPGESKMVHVSFDREENYQDAVTIAAEPLPTGISSSTGVDYEEDKDPPLTTGKRERYKGKPEKAVLVLSAGVDAVPASPQKVRIVVKPLVSGKSGEVLSSKSIYVMVTPKP